MKVHEFESLLKECPPDAEIIGYESGGELRLIISENVVYVKEA
jgi:hypothetical protein